MQRGSVAGVGERVNVLMSWPSQWCCVCERSCHPAANTALEQRRPQLWRCGQTGCVTSLRSHRVGGSLSLCHRAQCAGSRADSCICPVGTPVWACPARLPASCRPVGIQLAGSDSATVDVSLAAVL